MAFVKKSPAPPSVMYELSFMLYHIGAHRRKDYLKMTVNNMPSSSVRPDLDWSQVRETVRMLNLAIAQIITSMHEGDQSVETVGETFTTLANQLQQIARLGSSMKNGDSGTERLDEMLDTLRDVSDKVQRFIIAFQFYDKLSQRLNHVSTDLTDLAELVGNSVRIYNPAEWQSLQQQIRTRYSTVEEHRMFDALMNGAGLQEALSLLKEGRLVVDEDSVDIF